VHRNYWPAPCWKKSHLLKNEADRDYMSMEEVCKLIPGISVFTEGGLNMLLERIKVDKVPTLRMGGEDCSEQEESPDESSKDITKAKKLKIFCGVYSYDNHRDHIRLAALSYGFKCDGFLAFSTATIPSLETVALMHRGNETYKNMFQKTRSILSYVAMHYLHDYDYFHLGGEDMHLIGVFNDEKSSFNCVVHPFHFTILLTLQSSVSLLQLKILEVLC
jgi:hypothetical protein